MAEKEDAKTIVDGASIDDVRIAIATLYEDSAKLKGSNASNLLYAVVRLCEEVLKLQKQGKAD